MASKICHVVRVTNPNDKDMWVEIKVYDVIRFKGPNGDDMVIDFRNPGSVFCDDQSGDTDDNAAPTDGNATRHTTMRRVTNPDDDTYYLDLEFLDYIRFKGPNGKDGVLYMNSETMGFSVVDTDSTGATGNGGTQQVCSTLKIIAPDSDTAKEDENDEFIGVCVPNGVRFKGENGNESVLYLPDGDEEDTTVYETDDDGNDKAPENTDPNLYVTWADAKSTGDGPAGPWLKNGDNGFGINQGILWHITKAQGGHTKPWWLFIPSQQEKQWTLVLAATPAPHGYNIEGLFDYYRAEYGHGEDFAVPDPPRFPGRPIPPGGWPSADAQQRAFLDGTSVPIVGTGVLHHAPPVAKVIFDPDPTTGPGIHPEQPYTTIEGGDVVGVWNPNIWELAGIPQPFKKNADGTDFIDPDTGKKVPRMPSKKLAKKLVDTFKTMWNDTSNAYNSLEASFDGVRRDGVPTVYIPYPTVWEFAVMGGVPNPSSKAQRHWFCGGIPAGFYFFGGELNAARSLASTAMLLGIDQLDPDVWDLSTDIPVLWSPSHPKPGS